MLPWFAFTSYLTTLILSCGCLRIFLLDLVNIYLIFLIFSYIPFILHVLSLSLCFFICSFKLNILNSVIFLSARIFLVTDLNLPPEHPCLSCHSLLAPNFGADLQKNRNCHILKQFSKVFFSRRINAFQWFGINIEIY